MRKRIFKEIEIIFIFILFVSSCNKNTSKINTPASEYFPNTVGDEWIYSVFDSTTKKNTDVSVKVIGVTTLPKGETATIWIYKSPSAIDTNFVYQSGDTINIVPAFNLNPNDYYISKKYILPLSINKRWMNTFIYDSITVVKQAQFQGKYLFFEGVYFLIEAGQTVNYLIYTEEYFKPEIGIVQLSKYEYDFSLPENKVWYLKEYYLK